MAAQVLTTLEAHVDEAGWSTLRAAFELAADEPEPGLVRSYLIQGAADPTLWRIVTVWRDREALESMRASGSPPKGVLMFRGAGAEPTLLVADIVHAIDRTGMPPGAAD